MPRRLTEKRLVIASHNAGKVREIAELLHPFSVGVVSAADLDLAEPEETGETFLANSGIKAHAAARASGLPALADDSGLAVRALGGKPGVRSARWAGADRDFGEAMARVARELGGSDDRTASFVCALTLAWPDGHAECFEGRVDGTIVWPPRGAYGFGYDPIFMPAGHATTFGEMEPEAKHRISHRADAFRKLIDGCLTPAADESGA